jgi:hypothetical protein
MGNRRLNKIECLHTLGTPESERLKVTALNLFHPTASPLLSKSRFSHIKKQPHKAGHPADLPVQKVPTWTNLYCFH